MNLSLFNKVSKTAKQMARPNWDDYYFAGQLLADSRKSVVSTAIRYEAFDVNILLSILKRNNVPLIYLARNLFDEFPEFFKTFDWKIHIHEVINQIQGRFSCLLLMK